MTDDMQSIVKIETGFDEDTDGRRRTGPDDSKADANALRVELLKHLSKEVEHVNNQLIAQRTRNNLVVAFAPYLALGILASNANLVAVLRNVSDTNFWTVLVAFVLTYVFLGWLAARIEKNFWEQGNFWRRLIVDVSGTSIDRKKFEFSSESLVVVYVAIYLASALGFVFCLNVFRGVASSGI